MHIYVRHYFARTSLSCCIHVVAACWLMYGMAVDLVHTFFTRRPNYCNFNMYIVDGRLVRRDEE